MNEVICECGDYRYARGEIAGRGAFYFDYHHPRNKDARFANQAAILYKFKDRVPNVVQRFSLLMAQIAKAAVHEKRFDGIVVPILGSTDLVTDVAAPASLAAIAIAEVLGVRMIPYAFYQIDAREKLHTGDQPRGKDGRQTLVASVLRCNAEELRGKDVVLVDDVLTTGASTIVYANLIKAANAKLPEKMRRRHVASFYAMRTMAERDLLNPALYDELDREVFGGEMFDLPF